MSFPPQPSSDSTSSSTAEMRPDPTRAAQLVANVSAVLAKLSTARSSSSSASGREIRLIAVSKLKPASDIFALHNSSHKLVHFGENYAQELTEKAAILPRDIKWHMIGALQTNKCKPLAEGVGNLWCVSSVDSARKADGLEKGRRGLVEREKAERREGETGREKLRVLVQVNTSGEASKSGVPPGETAALCAHIGAECPHLRLAGLMTIGAIARSQGVGEDPGGMNEDFVTLRKTRDAVAKELGIEAEELELSMGMSADFEAAVAQGSDEVRVGTTIFGKRPPRGARVT